MKLRFGMCLLVGVLMLGGCSPSDEHELSSVPTAPMLADHAAPTSQRAQEAPTPTLVSKHAPSASTPAPATSTPESEAPPELATPVVEGPVNEGGHMGPSAEVREFAGRLQDALFALERLPGYTYAVTDETLAPGLVLEGTVARGGNRDWTVYERDYSSH
ncbi:MAG: hypothetical protein M3328_16665, partial [Chloroflexota bacterium]|nr:hypothetical protein [Chloroflexota bacterium]